MAPVKFAHFGSLADETIDQQYCLTSWSLIHLLSGLVLGFACWQFHEGNVMSYSTSVSIVVTTIFLWEPFERYVWAEEHLMNQMTDVLVGLYGLYVVLLAVNAE